MNYLQKHAQKLYENGYAIVPIRKGQKHPGTPGWESFKATPNIIKNWWRNESYTGVGVLAENTVAIDIDVKNEEVVEALKDYIRTNISPDHPLIERVGDSPKVLLPFRVEGDAGKFHKIQSAKYEDEEGKEHKLEILGVGNQFVAYHIHPDTKEPYFYTTDATLLNTKQEDLCTLNAIQAKALVDYFEKEIVPLMRWKKCNNSMSNLSSRPSEAADAMDNYAPTLDVSDLKVVRTLEAIDASVEHDIWVRVGMALYHQYSGSDYGFELFKTWSRSSDNPKHDGNISSTKWNSFKENLNNTKPITFASCLFMAKENIDPIEIEDLRALIPVAEEDTQQEPEEEEAEECIGEVIKPKLGSKERKKLDAFINRFVLVARGKKVEDKAMPISFAAFELEDFHQYYANQMIKVAKPTKNDPLNTVWREVSRLWLKSADIEKVIDIKYAPGERRFFRDDTGSRYANSFHFPDHQKNAKKAKVEYTSQERIKIFLTHIKYLFPIKEEREWFMQWVAFIIQEPQDRCPIMPIHVSRNIQGTGRSWVLRVLTMLIGDWNVTTPDVEQLIGERGNFNDHLVDTKIIACEELRIAGKDRYKVENVLKSDITDMTKFIRRKFGKQSSERLYGCFLGFTNYGDAIPISSEDRRYNVFTGPDYKQSREYYTQLMDWIDFKKTGLSEVQANIAQLFHYFSKLDISDFNVTQPMDTPARRTMMRMSKSDVEEMYDNFVLHTEHKVLTHKDVRDAIVATENLGYEDDSVDLKKVQAIMRHKATSIGRVRADNKQHRVWAVDNKHYSIKEATSLYEEYLENKETEEL